MKNQVFKYGNLISILLAEAWLCRAPDWEPAITFVGLIVIYIIQELRTDSKAKQNPDTELFNKFLKTLPSNGNMEFIRYFDGMISFDIDEIKQLKEFYWYWDNAEHEFSDKRLEEKRTELYSDIKKFLELVGMYTSPNYAGKQHVIPKGIDPEIDLPDSIKEEAKELSEMAQKVYKVHQDLVRTAKKVLKI